MQQHSATPFVVNTVWRVACLHTAPSFITFFQSGGGGKGGWVQYTNTDSALKNAKSLNFNALSSVLTVIFTTTTDVMTSQRRHRRRRVKDDVA